ncbi:jg26322 [Pararge aegeria aegeria]|uniref:Jg26322 protein n=1 Tax=Pararge aegeria aegeria TaxID=348720 RepID=A0A8S4RAD2_9NEOP|nr:jg26322 [Pararge aegeria aegeria]
MMRFESIESATRAKEALHGCDIYSGCCTLKIEFAKPERLNVFKNDQDSWDYTLSEDVQPTQRSAPLLQSPQYTGGRPQPYMNENSINYQQGISDDNSADRRLHDIAAQLARSVCPNVVFFKAKRNI